MLLCSVTLDVARPGTQGIPVNKSSIFKILHAYPQVVDVDEDPSLTFLEFVYLLQDHSGDPQARTEAPNPAEGGG